MLLAQYLGQPGTACTPLHLICTQVSSSLLPGLTQPSPELLPAGLMHSHRNLGVLGPCACDLTRASKLGHLQNQIRTWEEGR